MLLATLGSMASRSAPTAMLPIRALGRYTARGLLASPSQEFPPTNNTQSWAAGDAAARAVRLALMTVAGEMGYPTALSAPTWGFYASSFRGNEFRFQRMSPSLCLSSLLLVFSLIDICKGPYEAYVMQNVLFKVSFPAEFHAQTAVEYDSLLLHSVKR